MTEVPRIKWKWCITVCVAAKHDVTAFINHIWIYNIMIIEHENTHTNMHTSTRVYLYTHNTIWMTISERIYHYFVVIVVKIDSEQLWKAGLNLRQTSPDSSGLLNVHEQSDKFIFCLRLPILKWYTQFGHWPFNCNIDPFVKQSEQFFFSFERRNEHELLIFIIKDYLLL